LEIEEAAQAETLDTAVDENEDGRENEDKADND
jgi:hypothetical protein